MEPNETKEVGCLSYEAKTSRGRDVPCEGGRRLEVETVPSMPGIESVDRCLLLET